MNKHNPLDAARAKADDPRNTIPGKAYIYTDWTCDACSARYTIGYESSAGVAEVIELIRDQHARLSPLCSKISGLSKIRVLASSLDPPAIDKWGQSTDPSPADQCAVCRYFSYGECRRHAPIIVDAIHNWPHVNLDDWCGDFERRTI